MLSIIIFPLDFRRPDVRGEERAVERIEDAQAAGRRGEGACHPQRPKHGRAQTKHVKMITFSVMDPLVRVRAEGSDFYLTAAVPRGLAAAVAARRIYAEIAALVGLMATDWGAILTVTAVVA